MWVLKSPSVTFENDFTMRSSEIDNDLNYQLLMASNKRSPINDDFVLSCKA